MKKINTIPRDISWLSFNARVLQEAADTTVPLRERIKFLGIFSNNLDEFFRVRVAELKRILAYEVKTGVAMDEAPPGILEAIQEIIFEQQKMFNNTWKNIKQELNRQHIYLLNEKQLNANQKLFVLNYFNEEVRGNIVPLMIEDMQAFPFLNDKSIYLACTLKARNKPEKYALVSVPARRLPRFILLPSNAGRKDIILLEDIIRFCLPQLFSYFNYTQYTAHLIKLTRDAEMDLDSELNIPFIQKIEKGLKKRKKGMPVRLVYDAAIDKDLLAYIIKRMHLTKKDYLLPGGRIHNFKDFTDFPGAVFAKEDARKKKPFIHPLLQKNSRITDVVMQQDVLLHTPYHSFNSIIDFLREAAIDPEVSSIKITCYRLAARSKIINALTNAVRNGKLVTVVLELTARFDEEANLEWKDELEEAGVKVLLGVPGMKVHAKICLVKKMVNGRTVHYGFVGTGNLNERTASVYSDLYLLTSDRFIMADVNRIFTYLEQPKSMQKVLKQCQTLLVSPVNMRKRFTKLIAKEITHAKKGKPASIIVKLNSLSDYAMIVQLQDAAKAGVNIKLIIRGICCMLTENPKNKTTVQAISIVDSYLEHSRILAFHNGGKEKIFLSSADWMVRNLDYRVETACPVKEKALRKEIMDMLQLQLQDNVKARKLDNKLSNGYQQTSTAALRSQPAIYQYLHNKLSTKN